MVEFFFQWGITPLTDNFAEDTYFYVLKVVTGIRPGAGTRSKVSLVISGDEMDSGVRELTDGVRKVITIHQLSLVFTLTMPNNFGKCLCL